MNWTKITQIIGSMLITADGNAIYPIGDRIFNVGDYVWSDGKVAFGHETGGGGIVATTMAKIPILSYIDGKYTIGTMHHTYQPHNNYEAELLLGCVFVNDENNAFFLRLKEYEGNVNPNLSVTGKVKAYNMLTGKTIFDVVGVMVVDANIADDGDLLALIVDVNFGALLEVWYPSPMQPQFNDVNVKIYKNSDVIFDFAAVMHDIFVKASAIVTAMYTPHDQGGNASYMSANTKIHNAVINKDGSCKATVISDCYVQLTTVINGIGYTTGVNVSAFWEVDISVDGQYSLEQQTDQIKAQLNDGYYFTGIIDGFNSNVYKPFDVYDSNDEPITTINPLSSVYNGHIWGDVGFNIACITKIQEGYLIHLRSRFDILNAFANANMTANNVILLVTKDKQVTILKPDYGFNMRFAKMSSSKINILKSNLQNILKGDD